MLDGLRSFLVERVGLDGPDAALVQWSLVFCAAGGTALCFVILVCTLFGS